MTTVAVKQAHTPKIEVRRQGRQWAIYRDGVLIEGGFFSREAAADAAAIAKAQPL
jgi:hypothetical protein